MQFKASFSGNVTNEPTVRQIGAKNTDLKELRVAINHDKKNKDTQEYEKTGDTTWVTIKLWGERAGEDIQKGDLIQYEGTVVEKHFPRKGETAEDATGRELQSDYVESVVVVFRKGGKDDGFTPASTGGGF